MPSKKRGGLSKREVKRAQAAKAVTAPKLTARQPSAPKLTNTVPANFIGPILNTQSRGSVVPDNFIGPLRPGIDMRQSEVKQKQSSPVKRRKEAAKAVPDGSISNDNSSAVGKYVRQKIAQSTPVMAFKGAKMIGDMGKQMLGNMFGGGDSIFSGVGQLVGGHSQNMAKGNEGLSDATRVAYDNTIGIPTANAANGQDLPQSILDQAPFLPKKPAFDPNDRGTFRSDFATPGTDFSRPGSEDTYLRGEDPRWMNGTPLDRSKSERRASLFEIPKAQAAEGIMMPESLDENQKAARKQFGSSDNDPSVFGEMQFRQQQNDQFGGGQLTDLPGTTTGNRSGRGSGMFATGKGTQGNPLLDEYQSQLKGFRKQGNKMEDLYDEMIKALDPTYDSYSADIKKSVDEELRQNLLQLASTMNANNTGDSEQRAQIMEQRQGQSEAQLGDLLRKLMLQKQEDIQGIKEKKVNSLSQLQDRQMSTREKLAQLMSQMQGASSGTGRTRTGGTGQGGNRDAEFEKSAKSLVQQVLMGRMNRDAAAKNLSTFFPEYDENVIYDLLPDNYNQ